MNLSIAILFTVFFIHIFSNRSAAQAAFANESQSFKYNMYRDIWFDYQVAESEDSFHLYFRLDFTSAVNPDQDYELYYELRSGFEDKSAGAVISLNAERDCMYHSLNTYIFNSTIPKSQAGNLLVFHIVKSGGGYHYQYDVPLKGPGEIPHSDLVIYSADNDAPLIRPFTHEGDSFYIHSLNPNTGKAFIFRYRTIFDAADPPMRLMAKRVIKNLVYDTLFFVGASHSFVFPGNGLYFIQSDTTRPEGITVRCQNMHFPKLATMEDVLEPIIYMSTREELEKLKRSEDKKAAFEGYWLRVTKSEQKARKIIRSYYQKIEETNILFTTYKEGWKTDMGMIYLFFGAPNEVYNDGMYEKWYYPKRGNAPPVIFTFEKLRNVFSSRHYILQRREEYQPQWYRSVDLWRKGLAFEFNEE